MERDFFQPEYSLLEQIGWDILSTRYEHRFPADTREEPGLSSYMNGLCSLIENYYKYRISFNSDEWPKELPNNHEHLLSDILSVSLEGLRNAKWQGSKKGTPFTHIIYLGSVGVCQGFHDKGGYFKRPEVKEHFESKREITEFDDNHDGPKFHIGTQIIYERSDIIRVNIQKEVLYCVHLLKTK